MTTEGACGELDPLIAAAVSISSCQDLARMCHHVLAAASQTLDTETASLMLCHGEGGHLHWLATLGPEGPVLDGQNLEPGEGIAGWVARAGETVAANDVRADPRFCHRIDALSGFTTRSMLCLPLVAHGRILGVLELINRRHERPFTADDIRRAQAFASLSTVALENRRLFREAEAVDNLREIGRLRSERATAVASELRNPLTAIRGFAETLHNDPAVTPAAVMRFAGLIYLEARRMERLISHSLHLARLESGEVAVRHDPVPLLPTLSDCVARAAGRSERHEVTLTMADEMRTARVVGDRDRLAEIVDCLLDNALKYSPEGGPIAVAVRAAGHDWRLEVSDQGLGIPADSLGRVFHPFYRVPPPTPHGQDGAGLGLHLVKTLVERMGGRVGAHSQTGVGSTFWVQLPAETDARA